jgi:hypothetical protein
LYSRVLEATDNIVSFLCPLPFGQDESVSVPLNSVNILCGLLENEIGSSARRINLESPNAVKQKMESPQLLTGHFPVVEGTLPPPAKIRVNDDRPLKVNERAFRTCTQKLLHI